MASTRSMTVAASLLGAVLATLLAGSACTVTTTDTSADGGPVTTSPEASTTTPDSGPTGILGFHPSNLGGLLATLDLGKVGDVDVSSTGFSPGNACVSGGGDACVTATLTQSGGGGAEHDMAGAPVGGGGASHCGVGGKGGNGSGTFGLCGATYGSAAIVPLHFEWVPMAGDEPCQSARDRQRRPPSWNGVRAARGPGQRGHRPSTWRCRARSR